MDSFCQKTAHGLTGSIGIICSSNVQQKEVVLCDLLKTIFTYFAGLRHFNRSILPPAVIRFPPLPFNLPRYYLIFPAAT